MNKLIIYKKRKVKQSKILRNVFYAIIIFFLIIESFVFKEALSLPMPFTIILIVFSFFFLIVITLIFIALHNSLKTTVKTIEISPSNITFTLMHEAVFTCQKSNVLSIVAENYQIGDYQCIQFFILLRHLPQNNEHGVNKKNININFEHKNDLSFTSADLTDNNIDVQYAIDFLKAHYEGIFKIKKC